jgi:hypothetical protein
MDSYKSAAPKKTQSNPFAKAPAAIFKRSGDQTAMSSTPAKKKAKVSTPVETVNLDDGTGSEGEEQDQTTVSSAKVKTRAAREKRVIDEYVSIIKGRIAKDEADLAHKLNLATQLEGDEKIHFSRTGSCLHSQALSPPRIRISQESSRIPCLLLEDEVSPYRRSRMALHPTAQV